jgi:hypothetical protein
MSQRAPRAQVLPLLRSHLAVDSRRYWIPMMKDHRAQIYRCPVTITCGEVITSRRGGLARPFFGQSG